jgi:hypothetical protein
MNSDTKKTQFLKSVTRIAEFARFKQSWGARGRGFESRRPDHKNHVLTPNSGVHRSYLELPKNPVIYWSLTGTETQNRHKIPHTGGGR